MVVAMVMVEVSMVIFMGKVVAVATSPMVKVQVEETPL